MAEEALAAAKQAEAAVVRGDSLGLLHGVPVTVKDSFDMAGLPTLAGSKFRLGHRGGVDATAVARLRAAGAIILGKTNCPEFLRSYETDNYVTGRTNNPWDLERTPGGSSGGEAAAIASFCSAGGIGSDGGGSIRVPAHFCGIAGLKPTPGRGLRRRPLSADLAIPAACWASPGRWRAARRTSACFRRAGRLRRSGSVLRARAAAGARGGGSHAIGVMEQFYPCPCSRS